MTSWQFLTMPLVGGIIGWLTNVVAIRMMFRPRGPIKLPLLPVTIQGLLPKCQAELALNIGKTIEEELLPVETLIDQFEHGAYEEELAAAVGVHVQERLCESLPRLLPESLKAALAGFFQDMVSRELPPLMDKLIGQVKEKVRSDLHIAPLIQTRIMEFDLEELEELVVNVSHRELRHLELLGAILGILIGLTQAALMLVVTP
ncbi:MAG: DUF445 family protein [Firmicutes bacterium]|nr:DUF445 family protein [Bacillota bacterium]